MTARQQDNERRCITLLISIIYSVEFRFTRTVGTFLPTLPGVDPQSQESSCRAPVKTPEQKKTQHDVSGSEMAVSQCWHYYLEQEGGLV